MNYYPNYQYGAGYYPQPQYNGMNNQMITPQMPQYAMPNQSANQIQQTQQLQGLNGKIVDGIDVVKVTEVPLGGYGIFPKADMSEIYIKSWNNNGTTKIDVYKLEQPPSDTPTQLQADSTLLNQILEKLNAIDSRIGTGRREYKEKKENNNGKY